MTDREKVIKALENCNAPEKCRDCSWEPCEEFDCKHSDYPDGLIGQAISLLKAQEPRVMTLEEVKSLKQDAVVWYEHTGINGPRPRIVHYADDRCIVFTDGGKWQYDADGYSSLWRCWTSRPTDEQREAVKWE